MYQTNAFKLNLLTTAVISTLSFSHGAIAEETTEKKINIAPVVVTATRVEQNSFDLPVAIDVVDMKDIQTGQLQMQLSESLIRVPGVTAQNRNNQAQDPQISTRGFGSRSAFGVRGIRVYVDGIPLTMPDGQGQPGVVDLSAIRSIEVMRGPFSALYGNSSGGVIQMLTENAPKTPEVGGAVMFGSYNTKRQMLNTAGTLDGVEYLFNLSNFETDGFRDHNSGQKEQATAKFKFNISDDTKVTTLVNWFDQTAQDPLGLDRQRAFSSSSRESTITAAKLANTGVERSHAQVGFNLEHAFNENNKITLTPYVGTRRNAQTLTTTPLATQLRVFPQVGLNPCVNNGVCARLSEIDREFYGMDARWDNAGTISDLPYTLSLGLTYGKSTDDRKDTNILSNGLAVNVANRNEQNISKNFDQYAQGKLSINPAVDIHAGARHTKVRLIVEDNLLTLNGNNSGSVEYQKTTPVIGAVWKATDTLNFYANFGKGFETPTFIEAAFDDVANNVASKPNLNLKASESNNAEIGLKTYLNDNTRLNLTLYHITTKNEIVTDRTVAGRSSFTNANNTKRTGAEFSVDSSFDNGLSTYFAYTLLNAKFDSDFTTTSGNFIASGNRIPGTYRSQIYGEVAWRYAPLGFNAAFEGRHNSKVYVNDINTDTAPSYTIFNLRAGFEQNLANWSFKEYLRVENMFDKDYVGSVRINDGNALFYETSPDRNYLLGLSASYKF
ncbi:MAG: TonB-dependent receptor [Methylotenera sp.]|nr:TonB-dependent receptor [Methylotenera sp.]MDP2101004.1 TonB-dependent receptor [Methylotenera sp.]MDP2281811.1 TonB-dependent receptor [Methylotenera sp.]MDP2402509.1 TonB-dependent receptor [Methylotenera sp.]MDP3059650.1 TonB-dependent receptor [Methylotenera sp.]